MEVWGGNQPASNGVVMPGVDAFVASRPYEDQESGGDVHYVSSCATGRITRFLVADVSGHGAAVSRVAVDLRTLMRRYVNYVDQGRLVRELNREFGLLAEGGVFATAVVATYFTPTGYLTLCNAGHPRPMLYSAARRAWSILRSEGSAGGTGPMNIPLGIAEGVSYDQVGVRLSRGDAVVMYTDALLEARGADGRLLGEEGLLELARGVEIGEPRRFVEGLMAGVERFGGKVRDDATVLVIRPNELRPRTTWGERMGAGWRFVRMMMGRRGAGEPIPWPEVSVVNIGGALVGAVNRLWGGSRG